MLTTSLARAAHVDFHEVTAFLQRFVTARNAPRGLLDLHELGPLQRLILEQPYFDPTRVRVLLLGEFKAGKSTLLNALAGVSLAATDIFEMTSWVARYWPSAESFCRIQEHDGSERLLAHAEFLRLCQERQLSQLELARIARVDCAMGKTALEVAMIDAPGFGGSSANERRLIDALDEADVALLCVDADQVGGIREDAMGKFLAERRMPRLVALTKCDVLQSPAELTEIKEYVALHLRIDRDAVFPLSAGSALGQVSAPSWFNSGAAIARLRAHLNSNLSVRAAELRAAAERAHREGVRIQASTLLARIAKSLEICSEATRRFAVIARQIREGVQLDVQHEVERIVRQDLFGAHRDALVDGLASAIGSAKQGALSADRIGAVFEQALGTQHFDKFWQQVNTQVAASAAASWGRQLDEIRGELHEVERAFYAGAEAEARVHLDPELLRKQGVVEAETVFVAAARTTLGVAAVTTGYVAWLGPAAAKISLGAAATGVGIPVALAGVAIAGILAMRHHAATKDKANDMANEILSRYVEHFIEHVVRESFLPQLEQVNCKIEQRLTERFACDAAEHLPPGDVDALLAQTRDFLARVQR